MKKAISQVAILAGVLLTGSALPAAAQYQYDYAAAHSGASSQPAQADGAVQSAQAPGAVYRAAPAPAQRAPKIFDEIKIGGLVHDVTFGGRHLEPGNQINGEVLFVSPDFLHFLYSPRPTIGAMGTTHNSTSYGYAGLTWGVTLFNQILNSGDSFFINGFLGGAIHDGYIDHQPPTDDPLHKKLGSRILFRESVDVGYGITPNVNVSAFVDHISNANLGEHNAGITNVGGRVGFKF